MKEVDDEVQVKEEVKEEKKQEVKQEVKQEIKQEVKQKVKQEKLYDVDPEFVEALANAEKIQETAKKDIAREVANHFNKNDNFIKALRQYRDSLEEYTKQNDDPDTKALLETVDGFIMKSAKIADIASKMQNPEVDDDEIEITLKEADDFFKGKNGYRETMLAIKRYKENHNSPLDLISKSEEMVDALNLQITRVYNNIRNNDVDVRTVDAYIAKNSGDFNIAEGEELLVGVSKVCYAYNMVKKGRILDYDQRSFMDAEPLIDEKAESIRKNKIFKDHYKEDIGLIENDVKNHNEWLVEEKIIEANILRNKKAKEEEEKREAEEARKAEEAKEKAAKEETEKEKIKEEIEKEFEVLSKDDVIKLISDVDLYEEDFIGDDLQAVEPKYALDEKRGVSPKAILAAERSQEATIVENYEKAIAKSYPSAGNYGEDQQKAYLMAHTLVRDFENLSAMLKEFKKEFLEAQVDKTANSKPGAATEGPSDYRKILKNIDALTAAIDNKAPGKYTMGEISEAVNKFFHGVKQYEKDHKPKFRGHRTAESAKRYDIMQRLSDAGSNHINCIRSTAKETKAALDKGVGAGYVQLSKTKMADLEVGLALDLMIKDTKPYVEGSKTIADYMLYKGERQTYIDRILKQMKKIAPSYDVDGYYNSLEDVSSEESLRSAFEEQKPILSNNGKYANLYDLSKAGILMRDIQKLKTDNFTISQLKALEEKYKTGEAEKEISRLSDSDGFRIDMETASITGITDKLDVAFRLAKGLEESTKGFAGVAGDFKIMSANELKESYLQSYKRINYNLAYNIALSEIFGRPENSIILNRMKAIDNYYNADRMKEYSKNLIKRDVFDYIKKSGIVDDMVSSGKGKLDNVPELVEKLNDPEFLKGLTKVLDKSSTRELDRCRPIIRKGAEEFALRSNNPDKYWKKRLKESDKYYKKTAKLDEKFEEYMEKQIEKKKEAADNIKEKLQEMKDGDDLPKELINRCPNRDPAYAEVIRRMYKTGKAIFDDNNDIVPVSKVEVEKVRNEMRKKHQAPQNEVNGPAVNNAQNQPKAKGKAQPKAPGKN